MQIKTKEQADHNEGDYFMFEHRISIFTGHFGSGKTEVAVNYALQLARSGKKTAIVDMDIVNPFFRTADARRELETAGIRVIAPMYANTNVDVPSLPPEINTMFEDRSYHVVMDVGGDDLGARVLSRYNEQILAEDYIHYFVLNTRRPMTRTADEIEAMIVEIQTSARLKADRLVNNSNLLGVSTPAILEEASQIIGEVSERLSIPIGIVSGMEEVLKSYKGEPGIERLYLEKFIKLPWDQG
jgi:RecA/RadA recombinase